MGEPVLEVCHLVKDYGQFRAVDSISFTVPKGKVIGLLGPNGAGKSTTINMLMGVTLFDTGEIRYFGKNFTHHRSASLARINYTSTFNTLQGRISVFENLIVFADLYSVTNAPKKIDNFLEYFQITDLRDRRFWDLSSGQQTRVNLIKAFINDPELILMDEPTASLDPDIADKTLTLIETLRKDREISILYTSHDMAEVTRICDEVIFLDHGRIVAQDTPESLTKHIAGVQLLVTLEGIKRPLKFKTTEPEIPALLTKVTKGKTVIDIEIHKPTLEDVFLQIARKERNVT